MTVVFTCLLGWSCTVGTTDGPLPTPTPLPTRLTTLTITPPGGTIPVGARAQIITSGTTPGLGAFGRFSDGSSHYVDAAWTSSDASVIAIDGGHAVARSRGEVTLTATYEGMTDTETFRAEGGIAGRWAGSYTVQQCLGTSGSMQEVLCTPPGGNRPAGRAAVGTTLPLLLEISEHDTDLTAIVSFGDFRGTLTGKSRGGGFFSLDGRAAANGSVINIIHWDVVVAADGMDGFIGYEMRIPSLPGVGSVGARLTDMKRQ